MIHCDESTSLEDFSDGMLVATASPHDLSNGHVKEDFASDQVSSQSLISD